MHYGEVYLVQGQGIVRSLLVRMIGDADHALTDGCFQASDVHIRLPRIRITCCTDGFIAMAHTLS